MSCQGFYRGTSHDQVPFFVNKEKKMIENRKWPAEFEKEVDISKVNMPVISNWITKRITELLGFEDDIVIDYCRQQLLSQPSVEGGVQEKICPKKLQINLTGFLAKNSSAFVKDLWSLLLSAQENESGIPQQFLEEHKSTLSVKQEEAQRLKEALERVQRVATTTSGLVSQHRRADVHGNRSVKDTEFSPAASRESTRVSAPRRQRSSSKSRQRTSSRTASCSSSRSATQKHAAGRSYTSLSRSRSRGRRPQSKESPRHSSSISSRRPSSRRRSHLSPHQRRRRNSPLPPPRYTPPNRYRPSAYRGGRHRSPYHSPPRASQRYWFQRYRYEQPRHRGTRPLSPFRHSPRLYRTSPPLKSRKFSPRRSYESRHNHASPVREKSVSLSSRPESHPSALSPNSRNLASQEEGRCQLSGARRASSSASSVSSPKRHRLYSDKAEKPAAPPQRRQHRRSCSRSQSFSSKSNLSRSVSIRRRSLSPSQHEAKKSYKASPASFAKLSARRSHTRSPSASVAASPAESYSASPRRRQLTKSISRSWSEDRRDRRRRRRSPPSPHSANKERKMRLSRSEIKSPALKRVRKRQRSNLPDRQRGRYQPLSRSGSSCSPLASSRSRSRLRSPRDMRLRSREDSRYQRTFVKHPGASDFGARRRVSSSSTSNVHYEVAPTKVNNRNSFHDRSPTVNARYSVERRYHSRRRASSERSTHKRPDSPPYRHGTRKTDQQEKLNGEDVEGK